MKKNLFIVLFVFLFAGTSFSQETKVGLTIGANISTLLNSNDNADPLDYLISFQGGLVLDIGISDNFSVTPEILFSQRGAYQLYEEKGNSKNTAKYWITMDYVSIPVNATFKISLNSKTKWLFFAGPYISYAVYGEQKNERTTNGETTTETEKIKFGSKADEMKPLDFGINGGTGLQFGKGFFKFQCNYGLSNLNPESSTTVRNLNFALTAGLFF